MIYRDFEIEYIPGFKFSDRCISPVVTMNIELLSDSPDHCYTEEIKLSSKTSIEEAYAVGKAWVNNFWAQFRVTAA
jgi:hypothetical protein